MRTGFESVWRIAAARVVLFMAGIAQGGCSPSEYLYHYEGPTGQVAVLVEPARKGAAAKGRWNEVYVVGARPGGGNWGVKGNGWVSVGRFKGLWAPTAIAWISPDTVNICPLAHDASTPRRVAVSMPPGAPTVIHITTDCREAPAVARRSPH